MSDAFTTTARFMAKQANQRVQRTHTMPICAQAMLARFDERRKAGDAAKAIRRADVDALASVVRCESCGAYHVQVADRLSTPGDGEAAVIDPASGGSLVILDSENATRGAHGTDASALIDYWHVLTSQALTLTRNDTIVVGASRVVARKFNRVISGPNVERVIGRDEPEGADRALLGWARLNLRSHAQDKRTLVLISGDRAFVPVARKARKFGMTVHVITTVGESGRSSLSRELAALAHRRTVIRVAPRTATAVAA